VLEIPEANEQNIEVQSVSIYPSYDNLYKQDDLALITVILLLSFTVSSANHVVEGIFVFTIKPTVGCEIENVNLVESLFPNTSFLLWQGENK